MIILSNCFSRNRLQAIIVISRKTTSRYNRGNYICSRKSIIAGCLFREIHTNRTCRRNKDFAAYGIIRHDVCDVYDVLLDLVDCDVGKVYAKWSYKIFMKLDYHFSKK